MFTRRKLLNNEKVSREQFVKNSLKSRNIKSLDQINEPPQ